jgi:hypothetical protein
MGIFHPEPNSSRIVMQGIVDAELKQALADLETRLSDRIENTETKLLTAFHNWAALAEKLIGQFSASSL